MRRGYGEIGKGSLASDANEVINSPGRELSNGGGVASPGALPFAAIGWSFGPFPVASHRPGPIAEGWK
ncbi:MAG: hypothetical protein P1U68_10665 [Verrucomicrobiales bacterium]|nr:hypothetical protein [Verrucomicrobiales bacterium]